MKLLCRVENGTFIPIAQAPVKKHSRADVQASIWAVENGSLGEKYAIIEVLTDAIGFEVENVKRVTSEKIVLSGEAA